MNTCEATCPAPGWTRAIAGVVLGLLAGCATAPPAPAIRPATFEQKMSWILRLEDHRVLRDPAPSPVVPAPSLDRGRPLTVPPPAPDLLALLQDAEGRVRRRAALAVGRVGLSEGVKPLVAVLAQDPEPEVRAMAAFALGILGSRDAVDPLRVALADQAPLVQGRAAEALSLLNDAASGAAIAKMVSAHVAAAAGIPIDDIQETHEPGVEAFRLGVLALGRLKAYEPLAGAVLDAGGRPRVAWWPVAFALQRSEDRRALAALVAFANGDGSFGRAFAARGLGALKDPAAVQPLLALASNWVRDTRAAVAAVRALGQVGDPRAGPVLATLLRTRNLDPLLLTEVVTASGAVRARETLDTLLDLLAHPSPAVRAAALGSVREIDPQTFTLVLSGLDPDRHWSVRAATARVLGTLAPESALPRLTAMLEDPDRRVVPAVLAALTRLKAPGIDRLLTERLADEDVAIRAAAATALGELKPAGGERPLATAYRSGLRDSLTSARVAALRAAAQFGPAAAAPVLREALGDPDWSVRLQAATLLGKLDPRADTPPIRPAPTGRPSSFYESPALVSPPFSPQVYIETARGTIQIELAVLDAPLTCENFIALARGGFFDNLAFHRVVPNFVVQDGDPRGDGEGGSARTIRDELNDRPYLRGTVGMALDGPDTGTSQYFITHSPQPHLDGRYTVFGRVVSGIEVVDRLQPWDTIKQVRVWDGKAME